MIVLEKYKLLQKALGLDSNGGLAMIVVRFIYLIVLTSCVLLITIFFIANVHDDKYRAFAVLPPIFSFTSVTVNYYYLLFSRNRYYLLLDEIQEIVNERSKKRENEIIYVRAEQRISFVSNILIYASGSISIFFWFPFLLVAYHWCLGKYTIDSWFFLFPIWTSFEWNTASRCSLIVFYEILCQACIACLFCMLPCLMIGVMTYLNCLLREIGSILLQMNRLSDQKVSEPRNQGKSKFLERKKWKLMMLKSCKEVIDLQLKANRIMRSLADTTNFVVLISVMPWAMCTCTSLLIIEKYSGSVTIYDLQIPFLASVFPLILLAGLFYLGQKFHTISMRMSDAIHQIEWYHYPHSVQRFLLIMILRSQQPFYLSAYGIMELNMENFVGLLKWMYSAYMLLRSID